MSADTRKQQEHWPFPEYSWKLEFGDGADWVVVSYRGEEIDRQVIWLSSAFVGGLFGPRVQARRIARRHRSGKPSRRTPPPTEGFL